MKTFLISILLMFLTVTSAYSKEFTVRGTAKDYEVEATIDRYPLVIGDNKIEIEIRDDKGNNVTDAEVLVNYYMPPMPRMVPMNYRTEASLKSERYRATMNIIMCGPWYIKIIIKHAGNISTTKFNVDAQ
jgi:hypothetical protein